jgi:hypothetical protein
MEESSAYSSQLHNMSAPSRMRVTLRPLKKTGSARQPNETRIQQGGYQGLKLHAVLDSHHLFVNGFEGYPRSVPKCYYRVSNTQRVIFMLTELGTERLNGGNGPLRMQKNWVDRSPEDIEERFISLCHEIDTKHFSLPVFGLVKPCKGNAPTTGASLEPLYFISMLCRISGHLFMAGRTPLIPNSIVPRVGLGIYSINSPTGD